MRNVLFFVLLLVMSCCVLLGMLYFTSVLSYENKVKLNYNVIAVTSRFKENIEKVKPTDKIFSKADFVTPSCHKIHPSNTYIICNKSLPYSDTMCGTARNDGVTYKVPNVVHYVWFGEMNMKFYHYMSVRSAAANQKPEAIIFHTNGSKPGGEYWERVEKEIPCVRIEKMKAPSDVLGNTIIDVLHQTDVARMQILLQYGGIYLDSDALILKSLDPLRNYSFTMGRSTELSLSNGVMISEPNSSFLQEWFKLHANFDSKKIRGVHLAFFSTKLPFRLHSMRPDLNIHVEELSLQRPNPWGDGRSCISHQSFNISNNYVLHIHPQKSVLKDPTILKEYRENELRTHDSTYGAGARSALFGTQDLIFFESEKSVVHNRKTAKDIEPHKPMKEYHFSSLLDI